MRIAAKVALHKEKHPELYCPRKKCLWKTGDGTYCPRHKPQVQEAKNSSGSGIDSHSPHADCDAAPQTCELTGR